MDKRADTITWFYPLWSFFVFVITFSLILALKFSWALGVVIILMLILSEVTVYQYMKGKIFRVVAETDALLFQFLGFGTAALLLACKIGLDNPVNIGWSFSIVLIAGLMIYFKSVLIHSYMMER
jgi:hypothetical protein